MAFEYDFQSYQIGDNGGEKLSTLLLQDGADVNYVSNLPFFKKGSLIHNRRVLVSTHLMTELENHKFDFDKFMKFRNSEGKTPFLCFCEGGAMDIQFNNYFINNIWKKYSDSNRTISMDLKLIMMEIMDYI